MWVWARDEKEQSKEVNRDHESSSFTDMSQRIVEIEINTLDTWLQYKSLLHLLFIGFIQISTIKLKQFSEALA